MGLKNEAAAAIVAAFPGHANLTLARKLYNENKELFNSVDDARSAIRYTKGATGAKSRKSIKPENIKIAKSTNPYKIPDSESEPRTPYKLPKADNNILVISDLHMPYHSIPAITCALDYGKEKEVNTIVINGDLIDFHKISRFDNDPRKRSVKYELDTVKAFLVTLRANFPKARIYWLKGNHDVRLELYLMIKAPELFNDPYYHLEERLALREQDIKLLGDKTLVKAGKLYIHHGHIFFRGIFTPVNAARGLFLKAKKSIICGHVHKSHVHSETDLDGTQVGTWTTGCLCDLSPDYAPYANNYVHGFAHIQVHSDESYSVRNIMIKDGRIL